MKSFIILPGIQNITPELSSVNAFFAGQTSGWMTKKPWDVFVIFFITEPQRYREKLDSNVAAQQVLLFVDNHISRVSYFGCQILNLFNIELITFPVYCTAVLQPFDVGCAASLKENINKLKYNLQYSTETYNISNIATVRLKIS